MNRTWGHDFGRCRVAFFLLAVAVLLVYSNTYDASWHLDDYENILYNPRLLPADLTPESLENTFRASPGGGSSLYRPVVMLSFALNRYWGQDDVTGFHVVNTGIHVLTSWLLYLTVLSLFKTPAMQNNGNTGKAGSYGSRAHHTALLATIIWAIHPMQTQAVTYIVQRMASAGAMFFIAAMFAWLKARMARPGMNKILWCMACVPLFLLALGCKENTALLPLVCLLMEVIFFRPENSGTKRLILGCLLTLVLFAVTGYFMLNGNLSGFLGGYDLRSYTLSQRLMTQGRVVVFYLYQLLYPNEANFSIVHDPDISLSLFSPWTTLPAILLIVALIVTSCCRFRQFPLLGFSILFFFLNHAVESTVIPLELVFEHRNYLPSLFLFVPLAWAATGFLEGRETQRKKRLLYLAVSGAVTGIVFATGLAAYTRNFTWKSEESLWTDALLKAPERARPYQELAGVYIRTGLLDRAAALFETAVRLRSDKGPYSQMVSYDNIRRILMQKGMFDRAVSYGEKAVHAFPRSDNTRYNYALSLVAANRLEPALSHLSTLIQKAPGHVGLHNTMVRVLLKLGRVERAGETALQSMKLDPLHPDSIFYFGLCQYAAGNPGKGDFYLQKAAGARSPRDRVYLSLVLAENAGKSGWKKKREIYISKMISEFPINRILTVLKEEQLESYPLVQLNHGRLFDLVAEEMRQQANLTVRKWDAE